MTPALRTTTLSNAPALPTDRPRFRALGPHHVPEIAGRHGLTATARDTIQAIARVLPFKVNDYVLDELVDWTAIPDDPLYQLLFPQTGMLAPRDEARLADLPPGRTPDGDLLISRIRAGLNPHPSGQKELNVPHHDGRPLAGIQHKYRETVLYFPSQGQTCHAYCTYCFRWAQFIGDADLRFAAPAPTDLVSYLHHHPEVTDVLVTGGDPMVMSTDRLASHLTPLLDIDTVHTIRIGTKSLTYWPHRFVTDPDADSALRLFEDIVASGRTLAVMAHVTHPRELSTDIARQAIRRVRDTGAVLYCQAPLVAHVNDNPATLAELWRTELALGMVPYYQFVERDTGPKQYFEVPLTKALDVFTTAFRSLPGLARTIRGPVMSATPGKVVIDGTETTPEGTFFRLRMLQARDPELVGRPFRAHHSTTAAWLSDLTLTHDTPPSIRDATGLPTR
ncbi:KamA family radical SAM protein [Streptomyces sp. NPDC054854]